MAEPKYQPQYPVEAAAINYDPYELHAGPSLRTPTTRFPNDQAGSPGGTEQFYTKQDASPGGAGQSTTNQNAPVFNRSESGSLSHVSGGTPHGAGLPPGPS
jgi:hypothetical protein